MKVTSLDYKQYLINTQTNYTCDYMSQFTDFSGDAIERFLKKSKLKPKFIWERVKDEIVFSNKGCLIIDKVVLEHRNTKKIEPAYKQWSGSSHQIRTGIGVINLVYYNPEVNRYWLIDFRIWDKKVDGKKETVHAMDLLKLAVKRNIIFSEVLFDSFYASSKMLNYIALDLKKVFYTNLPSTRSCKESLEESGYKQIKDIKWNDQSLTNGKTIYLKDIPKKLSLKLYSIAIQVQIGLVPIDPWGTTSSERRVDNLCTNQKDDSMTAFNIQQENAKRWKVEVVHRELKQNLGIHKSQCRKNRSQRNHITCCILSWLYMSKVAFKKTTTIYQIKKRQLDDYMLNVMKHPYWKYEGV